MMTDSQQLPIAKYKDLLVESVTNNMTTVIVGETGSGKSTQLPQFLADCGKFKRIVCTQPRRVAAVTVAQRVAAERRAVLGQEVGYSIRFEDCSTKETRIKFVTDGVLLREMMSDRSLLDYSVVILDEAHERSLQTDILMGLLKQLQQNGTHLKVVVMSATLDVELFQQFFLQTNVVSIPGRQYPVQVLYTKHEETDIIEAMMLTCMQIHMDAKDYGAVLAFLPGQEDIEALQGMLEEQLSHCSSRLVSKVESLTGASARQTTTNVEKDFLICPLYANMPSDEQLRVFQAVPSHVRKFILATNIAETSITVPDIRYIVDSGFVKTKLMHPVTGMEMLKTVSISKAQANQRTGRAGRTSAGVCYRVYQEQVYERMDDVSLPEIQRVNLLQVILQLKEIGIEHILQFPLPSPPSRTGLKQAFHMLLLLRAIDETQRLTELGHRMAQLPLVPLLSHWLLTTAADHSCVSEVLTAVAMLSTDNVFYQPYRDEHKAKAERARRAFAVPEGDLLTLVNVYEKWKEVGMDSAWTKRYFLNERSLKLADNVRKQLVQLLRRGSFPGVDPEASCKPQKQPFLESVAQGLCWNLARKISPEEAMREWQQQRVEAKDKVPWLLAGRAPTTASREMLYKTLRDKQLVHVHPSSALFAQRHNAQKMPEYVVYTDILVTNKQYIRTLTAVDTQWIPSTLRESNAKKPRLE